VHHHTYGKEFLIYRASRGLSVPNVANQGIE
jgi:hypothetical protein